jgi:hypothetical protein
MPSIACPGADSAAGGVAVAPQSVTNFLPVTGSGDFSDPNQFEVTVLNGAVTSRIIQIVITINW